MALSAAYNLKHLQVTPPPPWTAIPMLNHPSCEELLPNVQGKPPLVHLKTVSSCSVSGCLGEEADPTWTHLLKGSCRE